MNSSVHSYELTYMSTLLLTYLFLLRRCFDALKNGSGASLTPVQIPFRRNETMYVLPQSDRIVIVYSVCFDDRTDQAIARVFLQVRSPTAFFSQ